MRVKLIFVLTISLLLPYMLSAQVAADWKGKEVGVVTVKVTNPSDADRKDVPVVINLHQTLKKKAANVLSAKVTTGESKSVLPSQLDDLDGPAARPACQGLP